MLLPNAPSPHSRHSLVTEVKYLPPHTQLEVELDVSGLMEPSLLDIVAATSWEVERLVGVPVPISELQVRVRFAGAWVLSCLDLG